MYLLAHLSKDNFFFLIELSQNFGNAAYLKANLQKKQYGLQREKLNSWGHCLPNTEFQDIQTYLIAKHVSISGRLHKNFEFVCVLSGSKI